PEPGGITAPVGYAAPDAVETSGSKAGRLDLPPRWRGDARRAGRLRLLGARALGADLRRALPGAVLGSRVGADLGRRPAGNVGGGGRGERQLGWRRHARDVGRSDVGAEGEATPRSACLARRTRRRAS